MGRMQKTKQATPVAPVPLIGPGFRGLNTELSSAVGQVDPFWALVFQNAVFDANGRMTIRKGYVDQTVTPMTATPNVYVVHEYVRDNGDVTLIGMADDFNFWESSDDGATWADITGSVSTAQVKWRFVNFNDKCYGCAPGHKIIEYAGSGTFTQVTSSNASNGSFVAAFGRLWVGRDASSIVDYSVLLDGNDFSGSGSGSIDAENAWTQENDFVRAVAAFGSTLVVFGAKQILMYVDGSGSVLGIDPDNMYVVDTIEGTGTVFRDSIINIGEGDLWYLSNQGVQSLARAVTEKTNPLVDITKNVRSLTQDLIQNEIGATGTVKAIFSPENQFALYLFQESDTILMFDTKRQMEDGTYRVSEWTGLTDFYGMNIRLNGDILFSGGDGNIHKYTGYRDDSAIVELVYASPWLDFGAEMHNRLKIIKQIYAIMYGRETLTATARWAFDFRPLEFSENFTNDYVSSGGEFGAGEYGEDEYGTGLRLRKQYVAGAGEGQFFKLWITLQSTDVDEKVAIQELGVYAKLGRFV